MEQTEPLLTTSISDSFLVSDVEDPFALSTPRPRRKTSLHRTRTAPAISVIRDILDGGNAGAGAEEPNFGSPGSILKHASALLLVYLSLGVLVYSTNPEGFSGIETHPAVDALYFCIVTLCTIGYGDIAPLTPATKLFSCAFVLIGFGIIGFLLSGALNYLLDVQERMVLAGATASSYIVDAEKGRMRIRMKVGLAVVVVVLCIGAGTAGLRSLEEIEWMDALYLSVMSVTTVGYGDQAFETVGGRVFASLWLLVSTLAVARAFLYLTEARIDKRHRRAAKWVLQRDLTVEDLLAADLNHSGFISRSEFVVYKLKEMGKIEDKDMELVCNQFNKLDPNSTGKITLADLLNTSR